MKKIVIALFLITSICVAEEVTFTNEQTVVVAQPEKLILSRSGSITIDIREQSWYVQCEVLDADGNAIEYKGDIEPIVVMKSSEIASADEQGALILSRLKTAILEVAKAKLLSR